jgi:hypothetical protein
MLVERSPLFFNCYRAGSDGCVGACMWYWKEDLNIYIYIYSLYKEEGRFIYILYIKRKED